MDTPTLGSMPKPHRGPWPPQPASLFLAQDSALSHTPVALSSRTLSLLDLALAISPFWNVLLSAACDHLWMLLPTPNCRLGPPLPALSGVRTLLLPGAPPAPGCQLHDSTAVSPKGPPMSALSGTSSTCQSHRDPHEYLVNKVKKEEGLSSFQY